MKFPKHRANCFAVERRLITAGVPSYAVCGVFPTPEGADAFAGACQQEFLERGYNPNDYSFYPVMTTFYDE